MKTAVQTGQKTFQQAAAENGKDWKDMIDDMAEVLEYGRKKGIELGGVIYDRDAKELTPADDDEPEQTDPVPGGPGSEGEAPGEAPGGPGGQETGADGETPGNGQKAPGEAAGEATGGQEAGAKAEGGK